MSWFQKLLPTKIQTETSTKKGVPEGLWLKCPACEAILYRSELERNFQVCLKCDYHIRIDARKRLDWFLDKEGRQEIGVTLEPIDFFKFKDLKKYKDRISAAQKETGEKDALIVMAGQLKELPVVVCAFEFEFMGGSMGAVVGERFVKAVEMAVGNCAALVSFTATGGARMQEGLISLLQMAKTTAALGRLAAEKLPLISVLTDPTMGGVSASFAMLGDVIAAEPGALIGFAGPRVIEQTVREQLPEGFQRSEFLLEHGAIDLIIHRKEMRDKLAGIIAKLMKVSTPSH